MPARRRSQWYTEAAFQVLKKKAAQQLLAVGVFFVRSHANRLNVSNPGTRRKRRGGRGSYTVYDSPSKRGEYPRARTGALKRGQRYSPTTVEGVIANALTIRVGMLKNVFYGVVLEMRLGRLGLLKTLEDLRPLLREIVKKTVR
jgi:hypothetical protein